MNYLLDTNAVIYLLKGKCKPFRFNKNDTILLSFITKIEMLSFKANSQETDKIEKLFGIYDILYIDDELLQRVVDIRKQTGFKIPDAIIAATAIMFDATLITSDQEIIKKRKRLKLEILDPLTEKK